MCKSDEHDRHRPVEPIAVVDRRGFLKKAAFTAGAAGLAGAAAPAAA